MNLLAMPTLCGKCQGRAVDSVIDAVNQNIVQICKCNRLWDRTTGRPRADVLFYTGSEGKPSVKRLVAGDDKPHKVDGVTAKEVIELCKRRVNSYGED